MKKPNLATDLDWIIWNRLKEIAKEENLEGQTALAHFVGMHPHDLSAVKHGRRSFGPTWIRRICRKAGKTEAWLLSGPKEKEGNPSEAMQDWKVIAENWKQQYFELKFLYDRIKQDN